MMAGLFAPGWFGRRMSWQGRLLLVALALLPWLAVGIPDVDMPTIAASVVSIMFAALFLYSFVRLRRSLAIGVLVAALAGGLLYLLGIISWHALPVIGYLALAALLCEDHQGVFS